MSKLGYRSAAASLGLCATLLLGGCHGQSAAEKSMLKQIRTNPSPELGAAGQSSGQAWNDYIRTVDANTRNAWSDFARVFLLDSPSRLQPYPMP